MSGWTLSRARSVPSARLAWVAIAYEGYDKEPEDLLSFAQQTSSSIRKKKDNLKQAKIT